MFLVLSLIIVKKQENLYWNYENLEDYSALDNEEMQNREKFEI